MVAAAFKAIGCAAALAGCTTVAVDARSFADTKWHVTAVNGQPTPANGDYRVTFENGEVGGRLGCNSFGGRFAVRGETLTAGPIMATQMGCSEPAAFFESAGFAVLNKPMSWQWVGASSLTLTNSAGSIALERLP